MADPHNPETSSTVSEIIDGRYPYTYCADQLRLWGPPGMNRSEAARLKSKIAEAIGMDERQLAVAIANVYLVEHGISIP